ncbi:hypothetical protein PFICI_06396 [Pestalotiopsis fici W106-1]|uniref:DUF6594 domain-containing protein n=1 Tax=Pestalotiopsis fici (strain W106-1 / CGMCC3.15140) TaxID=1229662 RepID=W3X5U2_PESFW|nr:uncharacterized protein PFICI_06396 [Pestalotiopsis fici W106-1]ETS81394.1 hypothetical protein PFICI_06396 [Pestalotiopsis fici W106-1]
MFHRTAARDKNGGQDDVELGPKIQSGIFDFADDSWIRTHHRDNLIHKLEHPKGRGHSYPYDRSSLQGFGAFRVAEDLRRYVQALQDYDYMGRFKDQTYDPFIITGEHYIERCMFDIAMKYRERAEDPLKQLKSFEEWENASVRPTPVGGTRTENRRNTRWRAFRDRIVLAGLGGIFLVGPMWLMVLHNTLYTVLVSTTVFIFVFGFLMALLLTKPMDVMASTAAYAAVLVVFVGLNVDSNSITTSV